MNDALHAGGTVGATVLGALGRHPDRIAFVSDGGTFTYRAIAELIGRLQRAFAAHGLVRGRCVALLTGNAVESWCAGVAAQASGMRITWLHPVASLADHLAQVEDAEADALVVDGRTHAARGGELAAALAQAREQQVGYVALAGTRPVFGIGSAAFAPDLLAQAMTGGSASPRDLAHPDDLAILNYTGGTTGRSKGVYRRHAPLAASNAAILGGFELPATPRYLAIAPISHVAGTKVVPTLIRGGTVHLQSGFVPERVLATIERERIDMTLLVPTMIYALLDEPALARADLSSLELLLYGASPMSPSRLVEGIERIGPVFSQLYGQTECYPISVLARADHDAAAPERFASCGFPLPGVAVALLDDAGQPVAPGEAGEICVRAAHVMEGYWKQPEQTAAAFAHGWLHTGDVARADERGYLYIVDRKKDMIVSGGFNVFPREVEDVLTTHPAVSMAAVIGVPDPKWGEAVTALVVLRPGERAEPEALIALVRERKGPVHAPKRVEFVDALPVTGVGKVDKKVLRERFWAGQARRVG
jgi:fatty-acyl-CoA synthase